jgi:hypothetical protein
MVLSITTQPVSQIVTIWNRISLTVVVQSSSILKYSWFKDEISIPGNNSPVLTFPRVDFTNDGIYYVIVTDNTDNTNNIKSNDAIINVLYLVDYYTNLSYNKILFNKLYITINFDDKLFNQLNEQLNCALINKFNGIIDNTPEVCYIVDYSKFSLLSNNDIVNGRWNKIAAIFTYPLYVKLFNLLYTPLFNAIYQKIINTQYKFIANNADVCNDISTTPLIYELYTQEEYALFNQYYKDFFPRLYEINKNDNIKSQLINDIDEAVVLANNIIIYLDMETVLVTKLAVNALEASSSSVNAAEEASTATALSVDDANASLVAANATLAAAIATLAAVNALT